MKLEDVGIGWFANDLRELGVGKEVVPEVARLDDPCHCEVSDDKAISCI